MALLIPPNPFDRYHTNRLILVLKGDATAGDALLELMVKLAAHPRRWDKVHKLLRKLVKCVRFLFSSEFEMWVESVGGLRVELPLYWTLKGCKWAPRPAGFNYSRGERSGWRSGLGIEFAQLAHIRWCRKVQTYFHFDCFFSV